MVPERIQRRGWTVAVLLLLFGWLPLHGWGQADPTANTTACQLLCEAIEIDEQDGDPDSAIHKLESALQLVGDAPPSLLQSELYYRLGGVEAYVGNLSQGLAHVKLGDSLAHVVCPEGCLESAQAAHELGTYYWFRSRNLRLSREHLESALQLFLEIEHTDTFTMSTTMLYLGYSSRDLGEYTRALELFQQALELRKRHFSEGSGGVLIIMLALANLHFTFDHYPEAKQISEDAIHAILRNSDDGFRYLKFFSNTLAATLVELGECGSALAVYADNLSRIMHEDVAIRQQQYAENLLNTAHVYHRIGDMRRAVEYFNKAAALLDGGSRYQILASQIQYEFAYFYLEQSAYDSALVHIHKATRILVPNLDPADLYALPSPDEAEALFELKDNLFFKGEIILDGVKAGHWQLDRLHQAIQCFDLAIRSLDAVWLEFDDPGDKLTVNQDGVSLYEQAIDAAYLLYQSEHDTAYLGKMHDYIERSKSQLMLETTRRARAVYLAGIPEGRVEQNQAFRAQIAELNERLRKHASNADSVAALNQQLLIARRDYASFSKQLEKDYPRYSQLVGQRAPASIARVQDFFRDPAELFVEYHLTDTTLYAISVHMGKVTMRKQTIDVRFNQAVKSFMQVVGSPNGSVHRIKRYHTAARFLYNLLLQPEIEAAGGQVQRIRIVPDRQLSAFPFEALLASDQESLRSFVGLDYAIRHFQISYASSASVLLDAGDLPRQEKPYDVLGLAWSEGGEGIEESRFPNPGEEFSDIPGTAQELAQIESIVYGRYFKGQNATEKVFKELAPDFGLIHIALHGRATDGEPYLAFPAAGKGEDGILYLEELYKVSLKARLTVLSACETGKGIMHEGEGVMSMARGFGIAGSPSTVMSLWEVDDQFSTQIMTGFYEGLAEGKPIDASLRDAKLTHLAKADEYTASPFYWATYIPVGVNTPIQLRLHPSTWPYYLGGGITICLIVFALILLRRRKLSA